MGASGTFITCMAILIIFNIIAIPGNVFSITSFLGLLVIVVPIVILAGIQILGSGISTSASNQIFAIVTLLAILAKLDLPAPFPIDLGLGIGTDAISVFPITDMGGIPFFVITGIVVIAFVSGIMMIIAGD